MPIVSFNIDGYSSAELAGMLNDAGFALRGGFQCAAVTHEFLGTTDTGVVRFAPSIFNTKQEVYKLINTLKNIRNNFV